MINFEVPRLVEKHRMRNAALRRYRLSISDAEAFNLRQKNGPIDVYSRGAKFHIAL